MKDQAKSILMLLFVFLQACSSGSQRGFNIPSEGIVIELMQRTDTTIPGELADLHIGIGDITRGKTFVTITMGPDYILQEPIWVGKSYPIEIEGKTFFFDCRGFDNKLIGNDKGFFRLVSAKYTKEIPESSAKEQQKIEKLLSIIEQSDVSFIRNGVTYSPKEVADHLRTKYENAKDQITSYDLFISEIASKSSMSGEPYLIKLKSGETIKAVEWYKLQKIE